ncbi:Zinc finger matrin-type protein 2 [Orchesella cincta]|uniref:Zinc finger matrin-type protein 2 n=1 Tax=Orchesella cincta TaxID=48709 RepID=A0A1D2MIP8_ORCCI|nr:Zinc finger matrin-type protein 2 [Orchesella cincta]
MDPLGLNASSSPPEIPTDHRRKWDREEFENLAAARLREEQDEEEESEGKSGKPSPVKRSLLKPRDVKIDLESRVGQSRLVKKNSSESTTGYYCDVCDCVVKDSINFLDHVNGKKHQRNIGMSMRVERSTLDQVKKRFELNKQKRAEAKTEYDLEERLELLQQEEERLKEERKERRRDRKRRKQMEQAKDGEEIGGDPEEENVMLAVMGFSSFG